MVPAVVVLDFDPYLRIGGAAIQLQTLALALVILGSILLAARIAIVERRRAALPGVPLGLSEMSDLRLDDLLFMLLGAVPGAVIGGRLGAVLVQADYYVAHPGAILDPGFGGLTLSLGVVGGLLSATYVGRLLDVPLRAWAHVAALPLLFGLAAAKVALALGGTGQGLPSDAELATAYIGAGPWGSLGPDVPAHPSQLYEALATSIALALVGATMALGALSRRDGSALLLALGLWAVGRIVVASTWRDAAVLGPLRAEQLVALAIALIAAAGLVAARRGSTVGRRAAVGAGPPDEPAPEWPDPETRPRF
ncbi:MAG: prolipoprotein diacylglyceryl transferase [Chloroflexi bacterium]|nr:prolipoprotein diacylglyceryl transferase [Chloroflexota bacterium]